MTASATQQQGYSGWRAFWERGGWWRALLFTAVYYAAYQGGSLLVSLVFPPGEGVRADANGPMDIFLGTAMPIILVAVLLVIFAASVGWLGELFGRQPMRGKWWMWVAVIVVIGTNLVKYVSTDFDAAGGLAWVGAWMSVGLAVGFVEELVTRGFVVNFMRKGGYREVAVAMVSALLFAALHIGNLFAPGQTPFSIAILVGYTFFFGFMMYLSLRVTGSLIWPILLHAMTDPATFMFNGSPGSGTLAGYAGFGNFVVILFGILLLITFLIFNRKDKVGSEAA